MLKKCMFTAVNAFSEREGEGKAVRLRQAEVHHVDDVHPVPAPQHLRRGLKDRGGVGPSLR